MWTFLASVAFGFTAIWSMHFGAHVYNNISRPLLTPILFCMQLVCTLVAWM